MTPAMASWPHSRRRLLPKHLESNVARTPLLVGHALACRALDGLAGKLKHAPRKGSRMRRLTISFCCAFLSLCAAHAQFGRGGGWTTSGADAQRSSWVRTDAKISKESLQKSGFQLLWKVKLNNQPVQLNSLTGAVTLEGYIGYRGFRTLAHLGGSSNNVFAVDTDPGRLEW